MTKKELKNAISETIYSNGKKGISGDSLAILLNHIVDAAGEGSGGGGNILSLDLKADAETGEPILTPSDENLQFRQTLIEGLTNNKPYIVFVRIVINESGDLGGGVTGNAYMVESYSASYEYTNIPDEGIDTLFLGITVGSRMLTLLINSDGSITLEQ